MQKLRSLGKLEKKYPWMNLSSICLPHIFSEKLTIKANFLKPIVSLYLFLIRFKNICVLILKNKTLINNLSKLTVNQSYKPRFGKKEFLGSNW